MFMKATNTPDIPGIVDDNLVVTIPGVRGKVEISLLPSAGLALAMREAEKDEDEGLFGIIEAFIDTQLPEKAQKAALRLPVAQLAEIFKAWSDAVNEKNQITLGESVSSEQSSQNTLDQ